MGWLLSLCIPSNNFKHSWRPSSQQSRITYDVWSQIHWIDHRCLRMQASYTNYAVGLVTYIDLFNWTRQRSNIIANMLISKLGVNLIAILIVTLLKWKFVCPILTLMLDAAVQLIIYFWSSVAVHFIFPSFSVLVVFSLVTSKIIVCRVNLIQNFMQIRHPRFICLSSSLLSSKFSFIK